METEHQIDREFNRAKPLAHKKSHGKFIALLVVLGVLLIAGYDTGFYWVAGGVIAVFVFSVFNGWVLLVEILR